MIQLLRTRRWVAFTALVIFVIAAFGFLSHWQWARADDKRAQRLEVASASEQTATALNDSTAASAVQWQSFSATGRYEDTSQVLVRQRPLNGGNGYWVLTPLVTDDGITLWVNRGWLAATGPATITPESPSAPSGVVRLNGWWRSMEVVPEASRTGLPAGMVGAVDPAVLPVPTTVTGYLQLNTSVPDQTGLVDVPRPVIDEGQNVSYAVQWLLFAGVSIVGWFIFLRREAAEDAVRAKEEVSVES
jgi:cytochrome oxidase assembly protein ShyY1